MNQNFTDLVNWSSGQIQNDNFGTFNGPLTWSISTGVKAISIANSGNEGSVSITQSIALNPLKSSLSIVDNATQTSGLAEVYLSMTSISSTIPLVKADYGGVQVFAIKKDRLEFPARTTTERDAISSPAQGSILYNTSKRSIDVRDTVWGMASVPVGSVIAYAGSVAPESWLLAQGQALNAVANPQYAHLYTIIGNTFGGTDNTNFQLPNPQDRFIIGSGSTYTRGQTGGSTTHTLTTAQMPSHTHGNTFALSNGSHSHKLFSSNTVGNDIAPNSPDNSVIYEKDTTNSFSYRMHRDDANADPTAGRSSTHTVSFSGSINSEGSGQSHPILNPYFGLPIIIKVF